MRSLLFVPADGARKLDKAMTSGGRRRFTAARTLRKRGGY
jgi:hypothetical protein